MELKPVHLIMVTDKNNNKYYDMVPKGDVIEIKYGRVDSTCTTITKPISEWNKIYNSKIKKGYVDKSDLVTELAQKVEKKDNEYKPIPNAVIADIVRRLQSFAQQTINEHYNVKENQVTQAMVDEAQTILISLVSCKTIKMFNETLLRLFTTIPRKMGHVQDYLAEKKEDFDKIITREQDLLDVMKSQVVVCTLQNNKSDSDDEYKHNYTILEALGIEIEETTPADVKIIKKELNDIADKYVRSWRIKNIATEERFNKFMKDNGITEFRYLWHGTRNENLWSILQKGLLLRPELAGVRTNGKMLGYAIYSSPTSRKSYGYTSNGYWTRGSGNSSVFMILNKVALGKVHDIYAFDPKYYNFTYERLQKEAPGCHSMWAHAGMNTGWGALKNDEIVVYKEDQVTCNYLVELR